MDYQTVFITGGAGFIGRYLVARCVEEGLKVVVYDNLCSGSLENIEPFMDKIRFYKADILDYQRIKTAMQETKPDAVFHLAAHHYIPFCNNHPLETIRVNVEGTLSVLNAAALNNVDVTIVVSSGAIYPSLEIPLHEDLTPEPKDIYGVSKLLSEKIARFVSSTSSLRCIIVRLFNTYGPFEKTPHLIPTIIEGLKRGEVIELGNLHTKRDYIYVEDVADALLKLLKIKDKYVVVNIGTGFEYSAIEIVNILQELIGKSIEVVSVPWRQRAIDKLHQIADLKKIFALTGWRPRYSLKEGLKKYLESEGLL